MKTYKIICQDINSKTDTILDEDLFLNEAIMKLDHYFLNDYGYFHKCLITEYNPETEISEYKIDKNWTDYKDGTSSYIYNNKCYKIVVKKIMIKANELRIGNKILFSDKEVTVTVAGTLNGLIYCFQNDMYNCIRFNTEDKFEPIPLTGELLLNMRAVKLSFENYGLHNIELRSRAKWNYFSVFVDNIYLTQIEYLHELQNLYFAINGTELI